MLVRLVILLFFSLSVFVSASQFGHRPDTFTIPKLPFLSGGATEVSGEDVSR